MKRNNRLMAKTLEALIEEYAFENSKEASWKDDAKMVQVCKENKALIKQELKARFNIMMELLDDEQTTENPHGTYIRMIEG